MLVLLLRCRLASAGARARILAGHSPFGCFHAPRTPEEFAEQLCQKWMATGRRPTVVGSGWGFFIGRARARDAVFTHRLKGRTGEFSFLAGTELRSVEVALRKAHGRTFWSTPTMQRISIGSWLARSCHGNSGAAGKPSSYAAARVLVVDLTTLQAARAGPRWLDYATIKHELDARPGQHAIAAVEFEPERMPVDFWLQKRRTDVTPDPFTTSQGLREWLASEAVLRVLFFGAARRDLAIGVVYVPFDPEEDAPDVRRECCGCCGRMIPHVDPHDCSAACMSMQLDTCSLVCGWHEAAKRSWRGIIKLSDANAFSPDPSWLGFPIIALLSGTVNFELIFLLPQLVAPTPRSQELRVQKAVQRALRRLPRGLGPLRAAHGQPGQGARLRGLRRARARHRRGDRGAQAARARWHGRAARFQVPGRERDARYTGGGAAAQDAPRSFWIYHATRQLDKETGRGGVAMSIRFPYFWSTQLDATQDQIDNPKDTSRLEGWIGLLLFNIFVWVTVVGLDIHLFVSEFQHEHSQAHVLQTAALVCVCVPAGIILLFTLLHMCSDDHPFSSGDGKEARTLPPFATSLIAGGLRATTGFSYLLLLTIVIHSPHMNSGSEMLKILVAQICLKTFGTAMATANQRYPKYYKSVQGAP